MCREIGLFGILRKECNEEEKNPERPIDVSYARRREHSHVRPYYLFFFREIAEHMQSSLCRFLEARRQGGRP